MLQCPRCASREGIETRIGALFQALLKAGDAIVSSSFRFGNTNSLWQTVAGQGVDVAFVDATDVAQVEAALTPNTRMVFVETIANPRARSARLRAAVRTDVAPLGVDPALAALASLPVLQTKGR